MNFHLWLNINFNNVCKTPLGPISQMPIKQHVLLCSTNAQKYSDQTITVQLLQVTVRTGEFQNCMCVKYIHKIYSMKDRKRTPCNSTHLLSEWIDKSLLVVFAWQHWHYFGNTVYLTLITTRQIVWFLNEASLKWSFFVSSYATE